MSDDQKIADERIATIYEVSADIGKFLQTKSGLVPAEAVAALAIVAGRIFGREAYEHFDAESSWAHFAGLSGRTFFNLGFENERAYRNEKVS